MGAQRAALTRMVCHALRASSGAGSGARLASRLPCAVRPATAWQPACIANQAPWMLGALIPGVSPARMHALGVSVAPQRS